MDQLNHRIRREARDLQHLSNEVCEHIEDVKDDILEELEEAEWRWHHIENRFDRLRRKVRRPARDMVRAVDTVADELQDTLEDIRRLWK